LTRPVKTRGGSVGDLFACIVARAVVLGRCYSADYGAVACIDVAPRLYLGDIDP